MAAAANMSELKNCNVRRTLDAQHGDPPPGKGMDGIVITRPAAQESVAVILHNNQWQPPTLVVGR